MIFDSIYKACRDQWRDDRVIKKRLLRSMEASEKLSAKHNTTRCDPTTFIRLLDLGTAPFLRPDLTSLVLVMERRGTWTRVRTLKQR